MKAIIINALKAKVEEIEVEELNLEKMYELIGCRCICIGLNMGLGHIMYVDDEGYLNGTKEFFKFKSINTQWFAGNGLIIREKGDKKVDVIMDAKKIEEDIIFMKCDDEESCPKLPPIRITVL